MMVKLNSITQWLRRGLPFIAVPLLVSCSSNTGERKVLPADEMAHVLYDYQLATSLAQEDNQGMISNIGQQSFPNTISQSLIISTLWHSI